MDFKKIFEDQKAFNRLVWDDRGRSSASIIERLKDLVIGMQEETLEFLRTYNYKSHRKPRASRLPNVSHSHEEWIDMFKYLISLALVIGITPEEIEKLYYEKSRVVQYRYQDEWMSTIDRPCVVIDIDEVLADYILGFCLWFRKNFVRIVGTGSPFPAGTLDNLERTRKWVGQESLGIGHQEWSKMKHAFRVEGGKRFLSSFTDAKPFLEWCRSYGWIIILITSRPIDRYPNIFTDTLWWLDEHGLPFDHLWWTDEKGVRLEEENLLTHIVFAVDDDLKFVEQFRRKRIRTYHLDRANQSPDPTDRDHVLSLHDIVRLNSMEIGTNK